MVYTSYGKKNLEFIIFLTLNMIELQQDSEKNPGRGLILIVEDDEFLKSMIVQRLKKEGFGVEGSPDGKKALEFLKSQIPALIILDLLLPGVDGFQVLKDIREDARLKETPVIVLSNLGELEYIDKAKALGANDYLIKAHFTLGEIMEKVNKLFLKK